MKPAADLSGLITGPTGSRYRWDAASPDPQKQPLDIQFDTASGQGCGDASVTIRRPGDREYTDLKLLNELQLYLPDGQCVYEGRADGVPIGDAWGFNCGGWWSHGAQRKFTDLIVDRDLGQWGTISQERLAYLIANSYILDKDYTASVGSTLTFTGQAGTAIPNKALAEVQYKAPDGTVVSKVLYRGSQVNTTSVGFAALLTASNAEQTADLGVAVLTLDSTIRTATPSTANQYLALSAGSSTSHTPGATAPFSRTYTDIACYGQNNVPLITRDDGLEGYSASEGIKYLAGKYAPKWDLSGVEATSYPIPQGVWRDPTTVNEAIETMNGLHLWRLGVWPGRKLIFAPYDLTVADWQVRSGVDGVTVEMTGDTTENVFNGMSVGYTDFQGVSHWITPADATDLRDDSEWITANQWGDQAWDDMAISWPCTQAEAVEMGRIALIEKNRARRPSTITVPMHIQDIHGSWQPSSLVHADQTISVMNQHSPTPRLITKTSWSNHQLTISTDNIVDTLSAFNARVTGALSAAGLA